MNIDLFNQLEKLKNKSDKYTEHIKYLFEYKDKLNSIELYKGFHKIYFDKDLIPILIDYYKLKVYDIEKEMSKFRIEKEV